MNHKHKNPPCYAMYESGVECMANIMGDDGQFECTGLRDTDDYWFKCPFYVPMCIHRENNAEGFARCETGAGECNWRDCEFFETKGEEA